MGIYGLTRFLKEKRALDEGFVCCLNDEPVHPDACLYIDAIGFLFFLLDTERGLALIKRQFGGSYKALDQLVKDEINRLLDHGLDLVFYFDGTSGIQKATTIEERRFQKEQKWSDLYQLCEHNHSDNSTSNVNLPKPPLSIEQFRATIVELGMDIVDCEGEADQEIAKACHEHNLKSIDSQAYCYGGDSDFLLMQDCPYIPFGKLKVMEETTRLCSEVWHRDILASALGMTECQLLEFSIILGNDYTKHFDRIHFGLEDISGTRVDVERCREKIMSAFENNSEFQLHSDVKDIQDAIEFSRALYNLEDISPQIDFCEVDEGADDIKVHGVMSLSENERKFFTTYFESFDRGTLLQGDILEIAINAIEELRAASETIDGSLEESIKDHHIFTMKLVRSEIASRQVDTPETEPLPRPKWADVSAAHYFQLVCRELFCFIEDSFEVSSSSSSSMQFLPEHWKPRLFFDGPLFHLRLGQSQVSSDDHSVQPADMSISDGDSNTVSSPSDVLPIEEHKERILQRIAEDRVTIIHGETG